VGAPVACKKYDEQITAQVLAVNPATANNCYFSEMLTPVIDIAEILPAVAKTAECKAGGDASTLPTGKVATTCTAIVNEAPAACAKPAPVDAGSYCTPFPSYGGCTFTAAECTVAVNPAYCKRTAGKGSCTPVKTTVTPDGALTGAALLSARALGSAVSSCTMVSGTTADEASEVTTCDVVAAASGLGSCAKPAGSKYNDASSCVAT
jgi:hypothetical protein